MEKNRIASLIGLSFLVIALLPNLAAAVGDCKGWKPAWSLCKTDSDCVVVSNPCGWPTSAANKASFEEAFKCNRIEGAALDCATWDEKGGGKRIAKCEAGKCANRAEGGAK